MIGTLITGAIAGLFFYYVGTWSYKMQNNIKKNRIEKRLASGSVGKMDLYLIITYYSNTEKVRNEGVKYVNLSEKHFPEDQELNELIIQYYMKSQNYLKAMEKIDFLIKIFIDNPNLLFAKGLCYYKLVEIEKAEEYRQKAILIDNSFKSKEYNKF
jgi:tetratricopeptide (TPR) repeat protein